MLTEINTPDWDKGLQDGLVIVDFWAPWCQACKQQQLILEALSVEIIEIKFLKLNIDDNRYLSQQLSVRNIPTLVLYNNKVELQRFVGVHTKIQLKDSLLKIINK